MKVALLMGSDSDLERLRPCVEQLEALGIPCIARVLSAHRTPEAVVERLQAYQEQLGISGVVLEMNYGGRIPYDRVINSMRLLAEKVVPKFK